MFQRIRRLVKRLFPLRSTPTDDPWLARIVKVRIDDGLPDGHVSFSFNPPFTPEQEARIRAIIQEELDRIGSGTMRRVRARG